MTEKEKCPLCPKRYESPKKMEQHCQKIHNCSYKEALQRELVIARLQTLPDNYRICIG